MESRKTELRKGRAKKQRGRARARVWIRISRTVHTITHTHARLSLLRGVSVCKVCDTILVCLVEGVSLVEEASRTTEFFGKFMSTSAWHLQVRIHKSYSTPNLYKSQVISNDNKPNISINIYARDKH